MSQMKSLKHVHPYVYESNDFAFSEYYLLTEVGPRNLYLQKMILQHRRVGKSALSGRMQAARLFVDKVFLEYSHGHCGCFRAAVEWL